jgi:hypothetical protein
MGAASCFLDSRVADKNVNVLARLGCGPEDDFVVVATTKRVGLFHQPPDFEAADLNMLLVKAADEYVLRYEA